MININTLVISLDGRNIAFSGGALPTSHSRYYDRCMFLFTPEWAGYSKTAVFWQDKTERYEMLLDETDCCIVPPEVQAESGFIFIGVIGRSGSEVKASKMLVVPISEGAESGNANTSITPTLYDQMLANFDAYVSVALTAAEQAKHASVNTPYIGADNYWYIWNSDMGSYVNSGLSAKGEKGDKGDNGKDGINGKDGVDGKDGIDGKDGADGITPHIGENGNWWFGDTDSGVKAQGKDGTGTGDMTMSVYDADGNGIVDNTSSLGGISAENYATKEYVLSAIKEAVGLALEGSY